MAAISALTLATLCLFVSSAVALPANFESRGGSKPFWARPYRHNPHWEMPSLTFNPIATGTAYYPTGTATAIPGPTATGPSPTGWYQGHVKKHDTGDYHLGFGNWGHGWHPTSVPSSVPTGYPTSFPTSYPTASPECDIKVKRHEDETYHQRFEGPRKAGQGYGKGPYWGNDRHYGEWSHQYATSFPTATAARGPTAVPTGAVPSGGLY